MLKERFASKEKFYSFLTGKNFSNKNCEHVLKAWDKLQMKSIKDYHSLYLKSDILLLANVLEKSKNSSLKNYGLCSLFVTILMHQL